MRSRLARVQYVIRRYRRVSQLVVLALLIVAPFLHIFRFDIPTMSLYLFGMRLWVRHIFFFSLLTTAVIYGVIAASLVFGRVFCGWVCPQNLFNELGRSWDTRFGRTGAVAVSALVGLIGGFVLWSYGTDGVALLRHYLAGEVPVGPTVTILAFGAFFTMAMAWWRTEVCKVACPYGHLQSIISNRDTMHLALFNLTKNRDICATCGLCLETCHMAVDPRTLEQKHCVACGDCLDACQLVSAARKVPRVLHFVIGAGEKEVKLGDLGGQSGNLRKLLPRFAVPAVLVLLLTGVTAYGLGTRPLIDLVVAKEHRAVLNAGATQSGGSVMRVTVRNVSGATETYRLTAEGLPGSWASFESAELTVAPGSQAVTFLRITPTERLRGSHRFTVHATGITSGATQSFNAIHVIGN